VNDGHVCPLPPRSFSAATSPASGRGHSARGRSDSSKTHCVLADADCELLKRDPRLPFAAIQKVARALAFEVEDGYLWFWIGSHADYDKLIRSHDRHLHPGRGQPSQDGAVMSRDNLEKMTMKLSHALAGTIALTIFSATIPFAAPAHAQAYDPRYPVCLQVYDDMVHFTTDCSFTTMAQCAATASGRYAQCVVNPYYAGPNTRRAPRKKHGT